MESLNFFFFGCIHSERFAVTLFLTCSSNAIGLKYHYLEKDQPQLADELLNCKKHLIRML